MSSTLLDCSRTRQARELVVSSLLIAIGPWSASPLRAQNVFDSVRTANGFCHLWHAPPGGSNPSDLSYQRCALERAPVLQGAPLIPAPRVGTTAGGSFLVVVNADGTVDPGLTRAYTSGMDSEFHRHALEAIRHWRFEPGVRDGKTVRSAFPIQLVSNARNDTLPSTLEWRYVTGAREDTLAGRWVAEAALLPFADEQVDSIYAALLRRLVRMQVVLPADGRSYCIVAPTPDSAAHSRVTRLASRVVPALRRPGALGPYECEQIPGPLRIVLPRVHRTENGRAVLYSGGDSLPNWPAGFDGRTWRRWTGRCVADVPARLSETVGIFCDIEPAYSRDETDAWLAQRSAPIQRSPVRYADGDSVRVTVFVTTRGAYLTDTLHAVIRQVPRLDAHAIRDPDAPCGGWAAYSPQDASELYVLKGDLNSSSLEIVRVTKGEPPAHRAGAMRCNTQAGRTSDFAAFLLGGIGDRAIAPITLCFSECGKAYVLDRARHTLAERPHVSFRLADLREDARMGNQVIFRIVAEPAAGDLLPLVVIRSGNRWGYSSWIPRQVGTNAWDYNVTYSGGYSTNTEVYIYLIAR